MEILELKNKINEMKNSMYGLSGRLEGAEDRTSKLDNTKIKMTQF